jgi:NAD(P)-dependent dehydrogenase (short-subunit alcohol dehydrogenase family)
MEAKNVLITGGSSGIGKALVERFARAGHMVWFTYNRGKDRATQIVQSIKKHNVTACKFEQGNLESQKKLLHQLPNKIDILINNAGLGTKTVEALSDSKEEQDRIMMQVNVLGILWLTEALLPGMKEHAYGKIIFLSSVGGGITQFPDFRLSDGMSKAAIAHLGRQLAKELSFQPIDVFTVCPGATDTPMFQASTLNQLTEDQKIALIQQLPGKRLITPSDIADLCFFLCQDSSSILRGAVLDASLGLGVHPGALTGK